MCVASRRTIPQTRKAPYVVSLLPTALRTLDLPAILFHLRVYYYHGYNGSKSRMLFIARVTPIVSVERPRQLGN